MALDTALGLALKSEVSLNIAEQIAEGQRLEHQFGALKWFNDLERPEIVRQTTLRSNDRMAYDPINCADFVHRVIYQLPDCGDATACASTAPLGCDVQVASMPTYESTIVDITKCVSGGFRISVDDFDCSDLQTPATAYMKNLERLVKKLARQKQTELVTALVAEVGQNYAGTGGDAAAPVALPLFDTNGKPQPMGMSLPLQEYRLQDPNGSESPLFLTGSGKVEAYKYAASVFNGNVDGQDAGRGAGVDNFYIDNSIGAILAAAGVVAVNPNDLVVSALPGSITTTTHLHHTNDYRAIVSGDASYVDNLSADGNVARFVRDLGTPFLGMPMFFDVMLVKNDCDRTIDVQIKQVFDLWAIPTASFCPSICSGTRTFNNRLFWEIGCTDFSCTDISSC